MFNKREQEHDAAERARGASASATSGTSSRSGGANGPAAVIGPSISINGELRGQEDLVVEGQIEGTVELKQHTLTVGSQGTLKAQVYAHTILVDGTVKGDLYASERISIRKTARIEGNILAPRISLEDGAKFRGSIDMDAESEAFRNVFQPRSSKPSSPPSTKEPSGSARAGDSSGGSGSGTSAGGGSSAGKNPSSKPSTSAV